MLSGLSRLLFVLDDSHSQSTGTPAGNAGNTAKPSDDSDRFTEPAPPSYEEALTLFMRDAERNITASSSRSRRARGRRGQNLSDDHELAVRLQREEIAQARERSASLSTGPSGSVGRRGDGSRVSVSSAPGDLRSVHGNGGHRLQHPRARLRTIIESEFYCYDLMHVFKLSARAL